jgi:hypothetical protein
VYRNDLCDQALELAGFAALRPERQPIAMADGRPFDQDDPLTYLRGQPFSGAAAVDTVTLPPAAASRPLAAR